MTFPTALCGHSLADGGRTPERIFYLLEQNYLTYYTESGLQLNIPERKSTNTQLDYENFIGALASVFLKYGLEIANTEKEEGISCTTQETAKSA